MNQITQKEITKIVLNQIFQTNKVPDAAGAYGMLVHKEDGEYCEDRATAVALVQQAASIGMVNLINGIITAVPAAMTKEEFEEQAFQFIDAVNTRITKEAAEAQEAKAES